MEPLVRYFDGEKQAGWLILVLGVLAIGLAVWLFRGTSPFRAMFVPLALVGILQAGGGVGLNLRTPPQVSALEQGFRGDFAGTKAAELARMVRVQQSFTTLKIVWVVVLAIGAALVMALSKRPGAVGIGMALAIEAALLLAVDVLAEQRGAEYLAYLEALSAPP